MMNKALLPDITSQANVDYATHLQWVGMEAIAVPLKVLALSDEVVSVSASADVLVSLDKQGAKGIHMSRLYLKLNEILAHQTLTQQNMSRLLDAMITSQQGISQSALVRLRFDLNLKRQALKSHQSGYQSYPVMLSVRFVDNKVITELELTIPYSSTCPCSAALSRQLLSETIDARFADSDVVDKADLLAWIRSEQGSVATPHSQRSYAYIKLKFTDGYFPDVANLIGTFEEVIGTPVQTAVKREDEQAFAKLNAENLMFCEDAARKIKRSLEEMECVAGYWYKVEHQESLHAHNAVVIDESNFS